MKARLRFLYFRMRRKARKSLCSPRPKLSDLPLPIIKSIEGAYKRALFFSLDGRTWIDLCMEESSEVVKKFVWLKPYREQVGWLISNY